MALIASESIEIVAAPEAVWAVIADIQNAVNVISGIKAIEILEAAQLKRSGFVNIHYSISDVDETLVVDSYVEA